MNSNVKDDKLKPLMPVLRTKKRFFRVVVESPSKFSFKELSEELNEELIQLLGAITLGKSGFWMLRDLFDEEKQEFICKVALSHKEEISGAFALISKLGKFDVALRVIRISGTLKGVKLEK